MIFKLFLCIIGIGLLSIFALPLMSVTLNIGNMFGIVYSICIILCGIFFDIILFKILLVLLIVFLIPFLITIHRIQMDTRMKDRHTNAVIILGCRVKGDKPSLALIERCNAGIKYLNEHADTVAILSGGQGSDELISEAECMCSLLTKQGINEERILIENKSTSTRENIIFSKKILENNGINQPYAIVSSEYHLHRAKSIAKDCDIDNPLLIPSKTKWYCIPTFYTREVFGIWAKALKIKE